jgi:hypothetical protein
MTLLSPLGAAIGGAAIAVAAGSFAPTNLVAFYLTALAAAVLLFAAFMAYLDAAEHLDVRRGAAVASTCLAAMLILIDAAIRFPAVLDPRAPGGVGPMPLIALIVVLGGLAGELAHAQFDFSSVRARLRPVRQLLSR